MHKPFSALIALAAVSAPANAHNIWLTTSGAGADRTAQVVYGDVIGPELADKNRVVAITLVSDAAPRDLRAGIVKGTDHGHPVLATKPFDAPANAVLAVSYDNGFWSKLPGETRETNTSSLMVPGVKEAHWTVKFGKRLLGPGAFARRTDARLELVPLEDPYTIKTGGALKVRLLLEGKPVDRAKINYTDGLEAIADDKQPVATTDKTGVASIPMPRKGAYLFTVDVDAPAKHPALAEHDHLYASLSFDTAE